jgi:hypothetical protein
MSLPGAEDQRLRDLNEFNLSNLHGGASAGIPDVLSAAVCAAWAIEQQAASA